MLESGAQQLIADGLADSENIGAIGFSRSCFQVMEEITTGSLRLKAASITDDVMFTYYQFLLWPDRYGPDYSTALGGSPFGKGLQKWMQSSPGFNLDKVTAPLLVNAAGNSSGLLFMWEPYAALRYLHKPVELVVLNTDEHILSNPAVRLASQQGSVDWFRFWLQGYEDPDPAKAQQYKRWRELKKLQAESQRKEPIQSN
jgi:dipeptidyl aminopeptidase/acylaminoacyl peptidase